MDDDVEQKEKDCFVSVLRCMERNVEDFGDKIAICDEHNSIASCVFKIIFGFPVVPDVKTVYKQSSASISA